MVNKFSKYLGLFSLFLFIAPMTVKASASTSLFSLAYDVAAFTATSSLIIESETDKASSSIFNLGWQWSTLTPIYNYAISSDGLYDPSYPINIKINYDQAATGLKKIYAYDASSKTWQALNTKDFPKDKYVSAETNSLSGRLALLSNQNILVKGTASWYKYKNGLFAASPDFPKGSILRVHNTANGKFVDVTINDWGPERQIHPDRVVDLDLVAFKKIADPSAGVVAVFVEPIKIASAKTPAFDPIATSSPVLNNLSLSASSAVLISEKDNKIIWGKNEKAIAPLASLTKLVAMRVFLDTKPKLKKIVTYKDQDEKYNQLYCKNCKTAKLEIKNGDKLTVENLLYASLVDSANNAVESLVRISGLSRDNFVAKMNKVVKNWGASSTHFIEPTGLSPENVSSPLDYAIISKAALSTALLQKITTTQRYSFKTINDKKVHSFSNTNQLIKTSLYPLTGSKTGYLNEAGYCLMTRVKTPKGNLISVTFDSSSRANSFSDNEQLVRYGLEQLKK